MAAPALLAGITPLPVGARGGSRVRQVGCSATEEGQLPQTGTAATNGTSLARQRRGTSGTVLGGLSESAENCARRPSQARSSVGVFDAGLTRARSFICLPGKSGNGSGARAVIQWARARYHFPTGLRAGAECKVPLRQAGLYAVAAGTTSLPEVSRESRKTRKLIAQPPLRGAGKAPKSKRCIRPPKKLARSWWAARSFLRTTSSTLSAKRARRKYRWPKSSPPRHALRRSGRRDCDVRAGAGEIFVATPTVRNLIREAKTYRI